MDRLLVDGVDERAPVQLDPHPPFALERNQAFSHGDAADAQRVGHLVLGDALARPQLAVEDQPADVERRLLPTAPADQPRAGREGALRHLLYDIHNNPL